MLLFPQPGWDLKACSQVKGRPDFALGQREIWDNLLETNQGWAGDELPRPWVYHATPHLFSVSHLSFKNTFVHLSEQMKIVTHSDHSGLYLFRNMTCRFYAVSACSKWQGLRGKLVDSSLYKSFYFCLWQLLQNSWEFLRATCCQSWEESSCCRGDWVCY